MASSSSALSSQSSNTISDREPTPEHPPTAAYETLAPQWWDERDWDFAAWSEDDASLTDGEEGLQFLIDEELEAESSDDAWSWDGVESSDEEEESEEDTSSDEYPPVKRFRAGSSEDTEDDDEDEEAPAGIFSSSSEDDAGSSADDSEQDDGEDSGDDLGL
jgi:hypothetical protein